MEVLQHGDVLMHPFVMGELLLGNVSQNNALYTQLDHLRIAPTAAASDVVRLIETAGLCGSGIGYVDAHLLASALAGHHQIWTRDRKLARVANRLDLAYRT